MRLLLLLGILGMLSNPVSKQIQLPEFHVIEPRCCNLMDTIR